MNRCLGKLPAVHRPGALMLAKYLPAKPIAVPDSVDNYSAVRDWGMMLNDQLGDCAIAAPGHMVQAWSKLSCDREIVIPDAEIEAAYSAITGYVPGDESTDQGSVEADVLDYWKSVGIGGHRIEAHAVVEPDSQYQVKLAIYLFGALYTGVQLPLSAQDQTIWTVVPGRDSEPGSWGGHAVPLLGYDAHKTTCITWGATQDMTWSWWTKYADEAHACLSADWVDQASKIAPNHLKWDDLKADLGQFRG